MKHFTQNIHAMLMLLLLVVGVGKANAKDFGLAVGASATTIWLHQQVTIHANVEYYAAVSPHRYILSYYTDENNTKHEIERKENSDFTVEFTYTPLTAGNYHFVVDVYDYTLDQSSSDEIGVVVENPSLTISSDKETVDAGTSCTLTATAKYFNATNYTFYVSHYNVDSGWNKLSSGTSPTFTFTPTEDGLYQFYVLASDGTYDYHSNQIGVTANKVDPTMIISKSANQIYTDQELTVTSSPVCCTPVKYIFYYLKNGSNAYTYKPETTENTCKFTLEAGSYTFKVRAYLDDTNYIEQEDNDPVTVYDVPTVTVSTSPSTLYAWNPITISATAKNVNQVNCYSYYYSTDGGENYNAISELTTETSTTFTPTKPGSYRFKVAINCTTLSEESGKTAEGYKDATINLPKQSITPNSNGVLSCVAKYPLDFSSINDIDVYVATDITPSTVTLKRVDNVDLGEAFIVSGLDKKYSVPSVASVTHEDGYVNLFKAADGIKMASEYGSYVYCLSTDGVFMQVADDVVIPENKAYLLYTSSNAKGLTLDFGETTGIEAVSTLQQAQNPTVYNILGQRVNANAKGMIIKNGKKHINK